MIGIVIFGFFCLGLYGLVCGLVYEYQDRLVFFPYGHISLNPGNHNLDFDTFEIEVEEGVKVTGWIVETDSEAPWVLHFHGNAGNISNRVDHLKFFSDLGYNGVVFDYRGYGESTGTPSESGLIADGLAVVNYLKDEKAVSPKKFFYFGESLGGGVAAAVAETVPPRALILKSTFTSVPDRADEIYPFLPNQWLAKNRFETKRRIQDFLFPKLILHGRADEVIPFHHGQKLFQAAHEPKIFVETIGGHNTSPLELGEKFKEKVRAFVSEALPQES